VTGRPSVVSLYSDSTLLTRAHVRIRWASCPFEAVAAEVPEGGRVLEVGCGHGLLSLHLALTSPDREVHGIDVDEAKLDAARAATVRANLGATFATASGGAVPHGPWAAIAIVDVLYLLGAGAQRALLATCAGELAAGGVLVVKEMAPVPAWKARWNAVQEAAAVKVLGITEGSELTFLPPAELAAAMAGAGLDVRERPLHRHYPHPHHLLVGRRAG